MKRIYLIRHCQAHGQEPDAPLTATGQDQAVQLASFLEPLAIERIVSSPFLRACQTIEPFAQRNALSVETDSRLTERVLSSVPLDDWLTPLSQSFDDLDLCLEGGESNRTAMQRGAAAIRDILAHHAEATAVVTHGGLMTLLLKHFDDRYGFAEWKALTNPDVYVLRFSSDGTQIERMWA